MRNYVIINGVNSLTKNGLAIRDLPPITKTMMRTLREEIDGRDGDIITELGYSAYDKSMTIGLFGTGYDIDDIIAFFNQSGTIVFSNEPDKFYNFKIIDQIDYNKLLKFKEATIRFHCQPFKYPLNEVPLVEEYQYVEATGTDVTLNNTAAGIFNKFDILGNTEQTQYTGANILPQDKYRVTSTVNGITYTNNGDGTFNLTGTATANTTLVIIPTGEIELEANQPYYLYSSVPYDLTTFNMAVSFTENGTLKFVRANYTYTPTSTPTNERLQFYIASGQSINQSNIKLMLIKGSTAPDTYEPYVGGMTSPNPLFPQPIQMVSGDNEITICGRNLFNKDTISERTFLQADGTLLTGTAIEYNTSDFIAVRPNTTYFKTETLSPRTKYYDRNKQPLNTTTYQDISIGGNAGSFTTPNNAYYLRMTINTSTEQSNLDKVMLSLGSTRPTYEAYEGQTFPINLGVENLFNIEGRYETGTGITLTKNDDGSYTLNGTANGNNFFRGVCYLNEQHTISYTSNVANGNVILRTRTGTPSAQTGIQDQLLVSSTEGSLVSTKQFDFVEISIVNGTTLNNFKIYIQLEKGNKVSSFSPYGQTPIEMASIPSSEYRDIFIENNSVWYKRKKINKRTLNGTEEWGRGSGITTRAVFSLNTFTDRMRSNSMEDFVSDKFYFLGNAQSTNLGYAMSFNVGVNSNYLYIQVPLDVVAFGQVNDFKTWLSNHVTNVYYILEEAEDIEITNETLIEQLEAIKNAISRNGQTNISQTNNDMPFVLDLSALELNSDHLVIDNIGNIFSKPTLDLEGTGIVDIYLNDIQMFEVDLTENNEIIINTDEMEAFNPETGALANRQVTGEYDVFKLDPGENDLRFSGNLTKATITNYERWL